MLLESETVIRNFLVCVFHSHQTTSMMLFPTTATSCTLLPPLTLDDCWYHLCSDHVPELLLPPFHDLYLPVEPPQQDQFHFHHQLFCLHFNCWMPSHHILARNNCWMPSSRYKCSGHLKWLVFFCILVIIYSMLWLSCGESIGKSPGESPKFLWSEKKNCSELIRYISTATTRQVWWQGVLSCGTVESTVCDWAKVRRFGVVKEKK